MRSFTLFRTLPYINCTFVFYALNVLFPLFYRDIWFYVFLFQIFANWVCTLVYHSKCVGSITKGKPLKEIVDKQSSWRNQSESSVNFCSTCDTLWPESALVHHCPLCRACISRHDHHCFFMGVCIGDKNQKYFLALLLHVTLCCGYVVYGIARNLREDNDESVWKLLLPVAFLSCWYHQTQICDSFSKLFVLNMLVSMGLCAAAMFTFQALLLYRGQTTHEFYSDKHVSSVKSLRENIRHVFARYGLLYFIFPIPTIRTSNFRKVNQAFVRNKNWMHLHSMSQY